MESDAAVKGHGVCVCGCGCVCELLVFLRKETYNLRHPTYLREDNEDT